MKLLLLIYLIFTTYFYSAQKKHWTNDAGKVEKKDIATSYYTLSKTDSKTYILKRYYKESDSLYEEVNYPTKDRLSKEGNYKLYFENRNLAEEGNYLNNLKSGVWKYYHEDGNLKESITFKLGVKEGEQVDYLKNNITTKYRYKSGKLNSLTLLNDEQGNQLFKEDTSDVAIYTFVNQEAIFSEGKLGLEAFIKNNSPNLNQPVYVSFNIDKTGKISEVSIDKLTSSIIEDNELKKALQLIAKMLKWEPAMHRGRIVKSNQVIKVE